MHVILRDPSEHDLAAEQLLVSDLFAVLGLEMQIYLVPAVIAVSDDRMAKVRELRPDLVSPARNELQFKI